jgi:E3 ubiquitin-protein ligase HERC4
VYAVGGNPDGQLGIGEQGGVYAFPQLVADLHRATIAHVCCGGGHSLALSSTGVVYSWGTYACGSVLSSLYVVCVCVCVSTLC